MHDLSTVHTTHVHSPRTWVSKIAPVFTVDIFDAREHGQCLSPVLSQVSLQRKKFQLCIILVDKSRRDECYEEKLILLDTRCILRRKNAKINEIMETFVGLGSMTMSSMLVHELTFEDGAEYRGMFEWMSVTLKTKTKQQRNTSY